MLKREARFHTELVKWLRYHRHLFPASFLFETKFVRPPAQSFPLSELSRKERMFLHLAKQPGIVQTHSDFGGLGTICDGSVISGGGFVFVGWHDSKTFYCIDIDRLQHYEATTNKKSLSKDACREIMYLEGVIA